MEKWFRVVLGGGSQAQQLMSYSQEWNNVMQGTACCNHLKKVEDEDDF